MIFECEICLNPAELVFRRENPSSRKINVCRRCYNAFQGIQLKTPKQRAENAVFLAAHEFCAETGLSYETVCRFAEKIIKIMGRYHWETVICDDMRGDEGGSVTQHKTRVLQK